MQRTKYLATITGSLAVAALAAPAHSQTVFNDNFNRTDATGLGANWTPAVSGIIGADGTQAYLASGGPNTMYHLAGLTGAYTHTTLKVDVSNPGGVGGQSIALCIGQANSPAGDGLYLQLRTTTFTGMFDVIEFDTGVNNTDASKWTTAGNQFFPTAFASARITASLLDVDTVRVGIDTDKNGTDEQSFTRDLNLPNIGFGSRMGISINGSTARADNFTASVFAPANVTWTNASGNGIWDSTSNNWTGGGPHANKFFNTDNAIFNNIAGGTVTVSSAGQGISPGSTTVNANSGIYTFAGAGIRTGTLMKTGTGRLILTNPNIFTGITTVGNGGGVVANGSGAHLTLNNPSGNALSGDLHIGLASATSSNVAKVNLDQPNQIADNRIVSFDSSAGNWAYWSLRGNDETVAGVVSANTGGVIENGNLNALIADSSTLTLAPPAATTHTFSGIIRDADSGGGTGKLNIVVNGAPTGTQVLTVNNTDHYSGTTTVNGGTLRLTRGLHTNNSLTIASGAKAVIAPATPSTYNPGVTVPSGNNNTTSKVNSLSITGTGQLDLGNADMAIDHNGSLDLADIRNLIASGYNFGAHDGPGIISSTALNTDPFTFALGYADNASLPLPYGTALSGPSFSGVDVDATAALIKFTWIGDVTLDGVFDFQDLSIFNGNYDAGATTGRVWTDGDLNYDGTIDFQDLSLFNGTYDPSKPSLPEPASLSLLGLAALGGLVRRRPRSHAYDPSR